MFPAVFAPGRKAENLALPSFLRDKSHQEFESRGLPCPVRSKKSDDLAGLYSEGEITHRVNWGLAFSCIRNRQILYKNCWVHKLYSINWQ